MRATDHAALRDLVEGVSTGAYPVDVLRQKRQDVLTARALLRVGGSVIVKLWNRPGLKNVARRFAGAFSPAREWRALCRLQLLGVRAPKPLAYFRLRSDGRRHTDAVVIEDLGPCVRASDRMQQLLALENEPEVERLEVAINVATAAMIGGGVLDPDHAVMNFVMPAGSGEPVRLDLELARRVCCVGFHKELYSEMLARLWGTYAFIVWPAVHRRERFEQMLLDRIGVPPRVLTRARARVVEMIAQHGRRCEAGLGYAGRESRG